MRGSGAGATSANAVTSGRRARPVELATRRVRDGQRIRVHGTAGYVGILDRV